MDKPFIKFLKPMKLKDVWGKKIDVMQHYDKLADIYDAQYGEEQRAKIEAALEKLELKSKSLVLDLGCGTGLLFEYVCGKADFLIGVDISKKLLGKAKEKKVNYCLGNVELVLADADHLPFIEKIFNFVFAVTLLQNMPFPLRTIAEMKRVSKKGCFLVITGLKKKFDAESFISMLRASKLRTEFFIDEEELKDYVAVCSVI